jgi:hypothetical protein
MNYNLNGFFLFASLAAVHWLLVALTSSRVLFAGLSLVLGQLYQSLLVDESEFFLLDLLKVKRKELEEIVAYKGDFLEVAVCLVELHCHLHNFQMNRIGLLHYVTCSLKSSKNKSET